MKDDDQEAISDIGTEDGQEADPLSYLDTNEQKQTNSTAENEAFAIHPKRRRDRNFVTESLTFYKESDYRRNFRVSKTMFKNLCECFETSEYYTNLRADKRLPAKLNIAVFLWFAGHEACSFRELSERFDLSISTVSRVLDRVTYFISSLSPDIIRWPTDERKLQISEQFGMKCDFHKAIGCIDITRIIIDAPTINKDDYLDKNGNCTLCLQGICDENKKFINIFVGYPGACDDSWVFENSPISKKLSKYCDDYYILGDANYPCSKHVITPYRDDGDLYSEQRDFNMKLALGYTLIAQTFGLLKHRFPQLYYCKLKETQKLCHFIRACCVLHNIADENDFNYLDEEPNNVNKFNEIYENIHRDRVLHEITKQRCAKQTKL